MAGNKHQQGVEELCEQADPRSDIEHFIVCPECGQIFDCRIEADVAHHARAGHEPKLTPRRR